MKYPFIIIKKYKKRISRNVRKFLEEKRKSIEGHENLKDIRELNFIQLTMFFAINKIDYKTYSHPSKCNR